MCLLYEKERVGNEFFSTLSLSPSILIFFPLSHFKHIQFLSPHFFLPLLSHTLYFSYDKSFLSFSLRFLFPYSTQRDSMNLINRLILFLERERFLHSSSSIPLYYLFVYFFFFFFEKRYSFGY